MKKMLGMIAVAATWMLESSTVRAAPDRIIVVGAGMAGLAAATELEAAGKTVLVVEARNRAGGRVYTDDSIGANIEVGAQWINSPKKMRKEDWTWFKNAAGNPIHPIRKKAEQCGKTFWLSPENYNSKERVVEPDGAVATTLDSTGGNEMVTWYYGGTNWWGLEKYSQLMWNKHNGNYSGAGVYTESVGDAIVRLNNNVNNEFPQWATWRATQVNPGSANERIVISRQLESEFGGDISEVGILGLWEGDDYYYSTKYPNDLTVVQGLSSVVDCMKAGLDIRYGKVVDTVNYANNTDGVVVSGPGFSFAGQKAIVTVPLGVLKSGSIEFVPKLNNTQITAVRNLKMGNGAGTLAKVILRWENNKWWLNRPQWPSQLNWMMYKHPILQRHNMFTHIIDLQSGSSKDFLVAWYAGADGEWAEDEPVANLKADLMSTLSDIFQGYNVPEPTHVVKTNWSNDPYARGSYSFMGPNALRNSRHDLMGPSTNGKLIFAGEHTSEVMPGSMNGAYSSGVEAARLTMQN